MAARRAHCVLIEVYHFTPLHSHLLMCKIGIIIAMSHLFYSNGWKISKILFIKILVLL